MPTFITRSPIYAFRSWKQDERGTALRAHDDVSTVNILETTLKGQDKVYGGPGQVPDYDYPNPQQPRRSVSLYTFTYLALALTVVPFHQTDWPNPPLSAPRNVSLLTQTYLALPLTAAPPVVSAYRPAGISGTAISDASISGEVFQGTYVPPAGGAPFAQTTWVVPQGANPNRIGLSWTSSFQLPLTTHKPPFIQYDWPVPKGYQPSHLRTWTDSFKLPLTTVKPPYLKTDWPNPRGYTRNPDWTDSFKLPLQTIVGENQYDWPNPRGYQRSLDLLTWLQTGFLEEAGEPFSQTDWPLPGRPRPVGLSWTDSFKLPLQTIVGANQYDWPNPRGYTRNPDWIEGTNLPLTVLATAPFVQADWPVPKGQKLVGLSWSDSFKLPLTTVVGANQYNWPNPRGYARVIDLWTWTQTGYLEEVGEPFNQTSWPVPKGPARLTALGWTDSFKLPLTTVKPPFTQYDWRNPFGPAAEHIRRVHVHKGIAPFVLQLNPFVQTSWPVPPGRQQPRYGYEQSTWLSYISPAIPPPEPPGPPKPAKSGLALIGSGAVHSVTPVLGTLTLCHQQDAAFQQDAFQNDAFQMEITVCFDTGQPAAGLPNVGTGSGVTQVKAGRARTTITAGRGRMDTDDP
jgi:hypothetical protein